jgi:hypothetical protein
MELAWFMIIIYTIIQIPAENSFKKIFFDFLVKPGVNNHLLLGVAITC